MFLFLGLSTSSAAREAALVLENLKPLGYQMGPRLSLDRDHLLAMCKPLGQYHALSYALRALNNPQLERLRSGLNVLPFIPNSKEADSHLYTIIYRVAFDRFFDFFDRHINTTTFDKKSNKDLKLIEDIQRLREKYFDQPTRLLEKLRTSVEDTEEDRKFAAILHGDYNRNNVLFKYKTNGYVDNVKMIDFQVDYTFSILYTYIFKKHNY